jgi:oligopeptide transport system substrate-binding protein
MLRNTLVTIAALLFAASAIVGCKKSSENPKSADAPSSARKVLLVGNGAEPQDLDPQVAKGNIEHRLILALFEGLLSTDPATQKVVPAVAERWEISNGGLVYTFHLRTNARWSNGDALTAHDFVRSYQRILTPALGAEYAYILHHVAGAEDFNRGKLTDFSQTGFKALDEHTLQLTLRTPTPFFLQLLAYYPWYPVHLPTIDKFGGGARRGTKWTRPENFVSNGPFTLTEWSPNQRVTVKRSATYWDREQVKLDAIQFFPIESTETEERMFRTGQLHTTMEVPRAKIAFYCRENPESIRVDPLDGVYFFVFNVKAPPLDNPKVRRALTLAIDRESITRDVLGGGELPAYNFVPEGNAGFVSRHRIEGDIEEARRLLAEAGYPGGKNFPQTELLYNNLEKHRAIGEAIQQMWRKNLGINIQLHNEEWKVYLNTMKAHRFQIARYGWVADYADPHVFLDMWETHNGNNDSNWGNAEYDRLLRTSLSAETTEFRYEIYQQMEKILLEELPILPIFFYTQPRLISPKVKGYYTTPLDNFPWKHVDLAE